MKEYNFYEFRDLLKYLERFGGPNILPSDMSLVANLIAFINSLTEEERRDPILVINSPSRWRRAIRGAGVNADFPKRRILLFLINRLTEIKNELR